jgi:hypothetical protein
MPATQGKKMLVSFIFFFLLFLLVNKSGKAHEEYISSVYVLFRRKIISLACSAEDSQQSHFPDIV